MKIIESITLYFYGNRKEYVLLLHFLTGKMNNNRLVLYQQFWDIFNRKNYVQYLVLKPLDSCILYCFEAIFIYIWPIYVYIF